MKVYIGHTRYDRVIGVFTTEEAAQKAGSYFHDECEMDIPELDALRARVKELEEKVELLEDELQGNWTGPIDY